MEFSDILIYGVIALAVLFLGPRILNRGRGGSTPGARPGDGGEVFPRRGPRGEPKAPTNSPDADGDFADRIEDDRPKKST